MDAHAAHLHLRERDLLARWSRGGLADDVAGRARVELYLENPCAQSCGFCDQPRQRDGLEGRLRQRLRGLVAWTATDRARLDAFDALCAHVDAEASVRELVLSGNDWALHPLRDVLLARLAKLRRAPLTLYGPSTGLADAALRARVLALPTLRRVQLSLHASDPAVHDAIVGAPGAGRAVLTALEALRTSPIDLVINVALGAPAVAALPATLAWLRARGLRATLLAVLPDRRRAGWRDDLFPRASDVYAALAVGDGEAVGAMHGAPFCAVPPALRERLQHVWESPHREPLAHAAGCARCVERARCPGVPASQLRAHGEAAVTPLTR